MIKEKCILDNKCYILFRAGNYKIGKTELNVFDHNKLYGELIYVYQSLDDFREELLKDEEFIKYSKGDKFDEINKKEFDLNIGVWVFVDDIDKKRFKEILNDNSKWR